MKFTKEYNLDTVGFSNDIIIKRNLISALKLYQNNVFIKKKESSFKEGVIYEIKDDKGQNRLIRIKGNGFTPLTVGVDGEYINLERDLTTPEKFLAFIPIVILVLCAILIGGLGGLVGGVLIGASIAICSLAGASRIRDKNSIGSKIGMLIIIGLLIYISYLILSIVIGKVVGVSVLSSFFDGYLNQ